MKFRRAQPLWIAALALSAVPAHAGTDPVSVAVRPLYEGVAADGPGLPLRVIVATSGPAIDGLVRVTADGQETAYPVHVAAKSVGSVIAYPPISGELRVRFDDGSLREPIVVRRTLPASRKLLVVTERTQVTDPVEGAKLAEKDPWGKEFTVLAARCSPESLPTRPAAFVPTDAIVLRDGADRLSEAQMDAVESYALTGGTVVLDQGAALPKRWISYARERSESIPFGLGHFVTLSWPKERMGKDARDRFAAKLPFGTSPNAFVQFQNDAPSAPVPDYGNQAGAKSPFAATLPSPERVAGILVGFFLIVVPVNFVLLRKLGRPEWAWFTTPVFSLAAAGLLFGGASELYAAKTAADVQGNLFLNPNGGPSVFVGQSLAFIAKSGEYDLRVKDADRVFPADTDTDPRAQMPDSEPAIRALDDGTVHIPELPSRNLQFHRFNLVQRVPTPKLLSLKTGYEGDTPFVRVRNEGKIVVKDATAVYGQQIFNIGDLAPGQSATWYRGEPPKRLDKQMPVNDVRTLAQDARTVAITGTIGNDTLGLGVHPANVRTSSSLIHVVAVTSLPEAP